MTGSAGGGVLLRVSGIRKVFGNLVVLDGVSLEVRTGEVLSVIGPSGSGKTTLLRCINALEPIQGGEIVMEGLHISPSSKNVHELREKVGFIFQSFNLFPHLTALQNVMLAQLVVKRKKEPEARETALKMLERVGLSDKIDSYPSRLSGGQQQRVAIARALAMDPKLVLMDEITSALDPELVNEVLEVVRMLALQGMTMIIVTHEMKFARDVSNRILFMAEGKIVEEGTPDQMFNSPKNERTKAFIGSVSR